jgi:hypothetical protein
VFAKRKKTNSKQKEHFSLQLVSIFIFMLLQELLHLIGATHALLEQANNFARFGLEGKGSEYCTESFK